ncbi:hypothetical protein C1701_15005 [Actinoalloteichus sp. AHMU CJ021]|nr:hypothetical protein C1701_15005 [Actinoalloteichus sp. AHMU CJ021]
MHQTVIVGGNVRPSHAARRLQRQVQFAGQGRLHHLVPSGPGREGPAQCLLGGNRALVARLPLGSLDVQAHLHQTIFRLEPPQINAGINPELVVSVGVRRRPRDGSQGECVTVLERSQLSASGPGEQPNDPIASEDFSYLTGVSIPVDGGVAAGRPLRLPAL